MRRILPLSAIPKLQIVTELIRREPDFVPIGSPCEAFCRRPLFGKPFPIAGAVGDLNISSIVAINWMLEECDAIAAWRNSHMAQVAGRFPKTLTWRIFEPVFPIDTPHNRDVLAVWAPVGVRYILEDFTIGVSNHGCACESSGADPVEVFQI